MDNILLYYIIQLAADKPIELHNSFEYIQINPSISFPTLHLGNNSKQ